IKAVPFIIAIFITCFNLIVRKGDVVWAPYRRDPLWPALVRNSYPKKITYVFFPLPYDDSEGTSKKVPTFSCHPKAVRALTLNDILPSTSNADLKEAYNFATQYLRDRELTRGSAAPLHHVDVLPKELKPQHISNDNDQNKDDKNGIGECNNASSITGDISTETDGTATSFEKKFPSQDRPPKSKVKELLKKDKVANSSTSTKRKHPPEDAVNFSKQPLSSLTEASIFAADSTTHSDTSPSPDLLAPTIFREAVYILERVWTTDLVQNYVTPPRSSMRFETCTGSLLSDHETDSLFDLIFTWVRERERDSYFLPGVHLVLDVLMPEVIIQTLEITRGVSRDVAERMVRNTPSDSITSSSSNTTGDLNGKNYVEIAQNNGKSGLTIQRSRQWRL
ncbi:hypothetical protein DICVIV_10061, partial [Dictyocaulus viviparus]